MKKRSYASLRGTKVFFTETDSVGQGLYNIDSAQGLILLNSEVTRQALLLSYLQDFRLMMWITMLAIPSVLFMKKPQTN